MVCLSEREMEIWQLVAQGLSNNKIARQVRRSTHTIKFHVRNLMRKLSVRNRTLVAVLHERWRITRSLQEQVDAA